ncbi:MAG TPA: VOC family protein [Bacilli bacterium]|nr:VOC family protein [Bacilli bacterium]
MTSPIRKKVKALFVHTDDLQRSVEWHAKVLGFVLPPEQKVEGPVFMVNLEDNFSLILDSNVNNPKEELRPAAMFDTHDIEAAYQFLQEQGVEILSEIQKYPDVCFFHFRDPDGHVSMVCEEKK